MCSAFKHCLLSFLVIGSWCVAPSQTVLRVCADPNDLPYSNREQQGFENKLAELIANELGEQLAYTWYPQGEKFFRKTLNSGACDLVMGVPSGIGSAGTTQPYYRSSYVFLARRDRSLHIHSFDDPRLRHLRIGVLLPGSDESTSPAAIALAARGLVPNIHAFDVFDPSPSNPDSDIYRALAANQIDVAVVWGPSAGFLAKHSSIALELLPVDSDSLNPYLPFAFSISLGVRHDDEMLKQKLNAVLTHQAGNIHRLLLSYGVPQLSPAQIAEAR
jgi:mxaJ protein